MACNDQASYRITVLRHISDGLCNHCQHVCLRLCARLGSVGCYDGVDYVVDRRRRCGSYMLLHSVRGVSYPLYFALPFAMYSTQSFRAECLILS